MDPTRKGQRCGQSVHVGDNRCVHRTAIPFLLVALSALATVLPLWQSNHSAVDGVCLTPKAGCGNQGEVCVSSVCGPLSVLATPTSVPFITDSTAPRLQSVGVAPLSVLLPSQPFGRPSTDATSGASRSLKDRAAGLLQKSGQNTAEGGRNKARKPNTHPKGPEWCLLNLFLPKNSARGGLSRLQWMSADTAIRSRAPGQYIS